MFGAVAADTARYNFAPVAQVILNPVKVLVVDGQDFIGTKTATLAMGPASPLVSWFTFQWLWFWQFNPPV
jgi:hypothetical protein